jgi:hypothetical protein
MSLTHADNVLRGLLAARTVRIPLFLGWDAFSFHGVIHPRHGPQASPCLLALRVTRRR